MDEFKVGDTVWCTVWGKGTVVKLNNGSFYPVCVKFDNAESDVYTVTGEIRLGSKRTLFFSEPRVEGSVERPFTPALEGKVILITTTSGHAILGRVLTETPTHVIINGISWDKSRIVKTLIVEDTHVVTPYTEVKL